MCLRWRCRVRTVAWRQLWMARSRTERLRWSGAVPAGGKRGPDGYAARSGPPCVEGGVLALPHDTVAVSRPMGLTTNLPLVADMSGPDAHLVLQQHHSGFVLCAAAAGLACTCMQRR